MEKQVMRFKIALPEDAPGATCARPEKKTKRLLPVEALGEMTLSVLGLPIGGHLMGRDSYGETFHSETNGWLKVGDTTPVTYYHGFGPDDPWEYQEDPAIIGLATLREVDERGWWFDVRLDESEELALRIKKAIEAGEEVRASSGAVGHLVRMGDAGMIDVWPVGELAIFDTNEWRRPANELAVVEMKAIQNEGATGDGGMTEAALEAGSVKSAAVQGPEADNQASQTKNDEPDVPAHLEGTMDELEMQTLAAMVINGLEPVLEAKLDARLKKENAGSPPQVQVTKDAGDQPWRTKGEFFQAVKHAAYYPQQADVRLRPLKATGMSEGVPADGGYLVPTETDEQIVERMLAEGEILRRISMDPVSGNNMLYNGVDESTHVGSVFGGITTYWLAEGATITSSKPKFYQLDLKLKKVGALCYATDEQLEDTANLESWLNRNVPSALRFATEDTIVEGDGVGKPLGILNSPALVSMLREDANEINLSDVNNMWSRRWAGAKDYVWLINPTASAQLHGMTAATAPVYLPQGSVAGDPNGRLKGAPVIETEYCQALGTLGDIMLVSLSQYQAISKGGVKGASSIHVSFATDETAFRFVYRIDGGPLWNSALTPLHGSTVSPFVSLLAASV